MNHTPSARVIIVFDHYFFDPHLIIYININLKMVAEKELNSTECLERKDRILREATFLGWKWSFLIAVKTISKPHDEGFMKIEDNMDQDFRKSRLSAGDLELSDQAYTHSALLCKDEACAYVSSAEDGNGYQAWQALLRARTARNATNLLNQLREPTFTSPDPRINIRQWNKNAEEYATRTGERVSGGI